MAWYFAYPNGGDDMVVTEWIDIGTEDPVSSDRTKATMYHECAHMLQYRAYRYDGDALDKTMNRISPKGGANKFLPEFTYRNGTEHMADSM
jgi:hypothetical protein